MVEGTGFENRRAGNRTGGSNPSSSASKAWRVKRYRIVEYVVRLLLIDGPPVVIDGVIACEKVCERC